MCIRDSTYGARLHRYCDESSAISALPGLGAVREDALSSFLSASHRISVGVKHLKAKILPVVQYLKEINPSIATKASPLRFGVRMQKLVRIVLVSAVSNGNNSKDKLTYEGVSQDRPRK